MKEKIIIYLLGQLMKLVSEDYVKELADMILDFIEDGVTKTPNKYDDAALILCKTIRETFDIPDND